MSTVIKPRLSEKTYAQSENGVFVFLVDKDLNRQQIAEAVSKTYDVEVMNVNVLRQNGKAKRMYRNRKYEQGTRSDFKKAYVTLKAGQSIPIFAAVEEAEKNEESK